MGGGGEVMGEKTGELCNTLNNKECKKKERKVFTTYRRRKYTTHDLGEKSILEREGGMHKNGEAGWCHFCFQSIKMTGIPGVEVLALGNVGVVYHFICPNSTPSFCGKQLLSHLVLFKPWDGHVTWLGLILVTQPLTSVIGPGIGK